MAAAPGDQSLASMTPEASWSLSDQNGPLRAWPLDACASRKHSLTWSPTERSRTKMRFSVTGLPASQG